MDSIEYFEDLGAISDPDFDGFFVGWQNAPTSSIYGRF